MIAFLLPYLTRYGAYAAILAACWLHGCHYGEQRISGEYAEYRIKVETAGRSAQAAADAEKALNEARKAASDASYAKALDVLGRDIGELRKSRASTNYLPAKPADSACPEGWACFDRTLLEQALQRLDDGVSGIVAEGDTVRLRLSTAIEWAKGK